MKTPRLTGCANTSGLRIAAIAFALLLLPACADSGKVRLFKDRSMRETALVDKLEPDLFKAKEQELRVTLNVSVAGGLLADIGREAVIARRIQSSWDGSRETLMARYMLICNDYNTGHITLQDYETWKRELDQTYDQMLQSKKELSEVVKKMVEALAELAQQQLDAETARLRKEAVVDDYQGRLLEKVQPVVEKAAALASRM